VKWFTVLGIPLRDIKEERALVLKDFSRFVHMSHIPPLSEHMLYFTLYRTNAQEKPYLPHGRMLGRPIHQLSRLER